MAPLTAPRSPRMVLYKPCSLFPVMIQCLQFCGLSPGGFRSASFPLPPPVPLPPPILPGSGHFRWVAVQRKTEEGDFQCFAHVQNDARGKHKKSCSSVFLCFSTQRKPLLHRLEPFKFKIYSCILCNPYGLFHLQAVGNAPTRAYHSCNLFNGELLVFGGVFPNPDPQPDGCSNELYIFNTSAKNWYKPITSGTLPNPKSGYLDLLFY